ncbi:MAG TPA: Ig-like domain-containing protein [Candidatus Nitrosotenuis sp.]
MIASTMLSSASATLQIPTIPELLPLPTTTVNISVESADMDGNVFPGQWVELWQDGVIIEEDFTPFSAVIESEVEYQVFIYDDPDETKFFDHWEDGSTDSMRTVTAIEDTTLTAFFQTESIPAENNPPEAGDDFAETTMNTQVTIEVLANDIDPDEDELFVDSIVVFAENGDVAINEDGTITYMPFEGFVGTDTFEYEVSDGNGGTDTALVTVDAIE